MASTITMYPLPDGGAKKINDKLYMAPRQSISIVSGTTVYSFTIDATANVPKILLTMPALSGAVVTGVVSIENVNGDPAYASSACAENDDYILSPDNKVPLVGTSTVKLTLSTDPLSTGTATITLYLEGGN